MTTEFKLGEPVWVTTQDGITFPTKWSYGPTLLELVPNGTFSRVKPTLNWPTMMPEWMVQSMSEAEAKKLCNKLIEMSVPCNEDTCSAIHATLVARWW